MYCSESSRLYVARPSRSPAATSRSPLSEGSWISAKRRVRRSRLCALTVAQSFCIAARKRSCSSRSGVKGICAWRKELVQRLPGRTRRIEPFRVVSAHGRSLDHLVNVGLRHLWTWTSHGTLLQSSRDGCVRPQRKVARAEIPMNMRPSSSCHRLFPRTRYLRESSPPRPSTRAGVDAPRFVERSILNGDELLIGREGRLSVF